MPKTLDFKGFFASMHTSIRETRLWRIDRTDGVGVAVAVPYRPTKSPKHSQKQKGPYLGAIILQKLISPNLDTNSKNFRKIKKGLIWIKQ